jgi:hypothetical protein
MVRRIVASHKKYFVVLDHDTLPNQSHITSQLPALIKYLHIATQYSKVLCHDGLC